MAEVLVHVGDECVGLDDVGERRARRGQSGLDVLADLADLRPHVTLAHDVTGPVPRQLAGDETEATTLDRDDVGVRRVAAAARGGESLRLDVLSRDRHARVLLPGDSAGPVVPRPRRERDRELDVLVEEITLGRERGGGSTDALEIVVARSVALLDGEPRVAYCCALTASARKRNGRSAEDQTLGLAADRGMPERPSRMGAERYGDLRQRDTAGLVAVDVDRGDERAVRRTGARRQRREVEATGPRVMARIVGVGDAVEDRVEGLERHRAAIGEARMPARRRLDSLGHPTVQIHETRA